MSKLQVYPGAVEDLAGMLERHPEVQVAGSARVGELEWEQNGRRRSITIDDGAQPLYGLIELLDNNPLVCADSMSLPSPAGTLALIALGPLIHACIVRETPSVMLAFEATEGEIERALASAGWQGGVTVTVQDPPHGSVLSATAFCVVETPEALTDFDDLFSEAFGRSFFIHRDEDSPWDVDLADGGQNAYYRLRVSPDEPNSLLTIQVMADRCGKCGAGQIIHAMNVMAGFEESLGIS